MAKSTRKSIIPQDDERKCYLCGDWNATDTHHCIFGTANRRKADEDGLTVRLCATCHRRLHDHGEGKVLLQQIAQHCWEAIYGDREDFIARFGKSYFV